MKRERERGREREECGIVRRWRAREWKRGKESVSAFMRDFHERVPEREKEREERERERK